MPDNKDANASNSAYSSVSNIKKSTEAISPPWYYKLAIKLLKPIYRLVLWRRYRQAKKSDMPVADYKQEIDSRYGRDYPQPPAYSIPSSSTPSALNGANIWCHAVSLGETNTIAPMLKVMLQQGARIWITNTTQTGFARTEQLFAEAIANQQMVHTFVPVDDKAIIEKFVNKARPDLAMFVETELWANILAVLKQSAIPSVLVNARLSQKSFESYAKYASVSKSMMHNISMIIAQDADSAKRFRRLGADVVKIRRANSLKWSTGTAPATAQSELTVTAKVQALQAEFGANSEVFNRPIWVAGSTHEGEEKAVIETHKQIIAQANLANALLIIVPRHPERFDAVAELLDQSGLVYQRRSQQQLIEANTQVYLADTMGELTACYQLADVALVGGSLVNIGGHNPIEAASLAKPVIMGPYTQSCHEVVAALNEVGALKVVNAVNSTQKDKVSKISGNASAMPNASLLDSVIQWLTYPEQAKQAGQQGQKLVATKSNAMQQQLQMIEGLLTATKMANQAPDPKDDEVDLDHFKVRKRGEDEAL
ncbi:3-deoxy-D-manno-octulosonic acid transferase [Psychrobacter sp. UBA3962]|uniref:3-deoxy-D-manno-octulosonic acid transferase n=1 Tax=Psychrobacter sp. UBA3962 TaxID=1947352 RepID=UPI0025E8051F|nr:3-deoxy-D-manno-octulosonic acid transferase [Psychrobacter sp. UBA3962]